MKSTTLCLALAVALCYLVVVESSPIQTDVSDPQKEVARQSGPIVSPAVPGGSDDDDDDGRGFNIFVGCLKESKSPSHR